MFNLKILFIAHENFMRMNFVINFNFSEKIVPVFKLLEILLPVKTENHRLHFFCFKCIWNVHH